MGFLSRRLPEKILGVLLLITFCWFYWAESIDAYLVQRQTARILAPLDKKVAAAESSGLAAAAGLKDQRSKILQSVADEGRFSGGYHPYLFPENRVFVHRLRKVNHQTTAAWIERVSASLNPLARRLFDGEAGRWLLYGLLCLIYFGFVALRFFRRKTVMPSRGA